MSQVLKYKPGIAFIFLHIGQFLPASIFKNTLNIKNQILNLIISIGWGGKRPSLQKGFRSQHDLSEKEIIPHN